MARGIEVRGRVLLGVWSAGKRGGQWRNHPMMRKVV